MSDARVNLDPKIGRLLATARFAISVAEPRHLKRRLARSGTSKADAASAAAVAAIQALGSVPEVAFVGRSNAGKSTAINAMCQRRRLAFASKTPGRTQLINFFAVGFGRQSQGFIVDLPGYGYAATPQDVKRNWGRVVSEYLQTREPLSAVVVVMDARRPFTELDHQLLDWGAKATSARRWLALITKSDKLTHSEKIKCLTQARATAAEVSATLGISVECLMISASSGTGLDALREWVESLFPAVGAEVANGDLSVPTSRNAPEAGAPAGGPHHFENDAIAGP